MSPMPSGIIAPAQLVPALGAPTVFTVPSGWTLVAEWDSREGDLVDLVAEMTNVQMGDFAWSPDGTKLTIGGSGDDIVRTFTCSTPFDPDTASVVFSSRGVTNPSNIKFTNGGTRWLQIHIVGDEIFELPVTNYAVGPSAVSSIITKADVGFTGSSDGVFISAEDGSYLLWWGQDAGGLKIKYITTTGGDLDLFTVVNTVIDNKGQSLFIKNPTALSLDEKSFYINEGATGIYLGTMPDPHDIDNLSYNGPHDLDTLFTYTWTIVSLWIDPNDTQYFWVGGETGTNEIQFAKFDTGA